MNRIDSDRLNMVDMNIIQLLADLKDTRGAPGETDSAFGGRMRDENEAALLANTHSITSTGIIIPTLPATCSTVVDVVTSNLQR